MRGITRAGIIMFNLIDTDLELQISDKNLDIGRVVRQNEQLIAVRFFRLSDMERVEIVYEYEQAFLDHVLYTNGEAGQAIVDDIYLCRHRDSLKDSLHALEIIKDEEAIAQTISRIAEVEDAIEENREKFYQAIEDEKKEDYQYQIKRYSFNLEGSLTAAAKSYYHLIESKKRYDDYSGIKVGKKYKEVEERYTLAEKDAKIYIRRAQGCEKKIAGYYDESCAHIMV